MDDWIVIAPSRWKLRKAVAQVNRVLDALLVEQHPDKTFIGRAERGFDFLGYHFTPDGLSVAEKTVERFVERATGRGAGTGGALRRLPVWGICETVVLLGKGGIGG